MKDRCDNCGVCYRCSKAGIAVTWRGGGGLTRADFHNSTNAQYCRETEARAAARGTELERLPARAELI